MKKFDMLFWLMVFITVVAIGFTYNMVNKKEHQNGYPTAPVKEIK